jgi:alkylation response protein AidB-like acyl-CoA dehydrogenase
MELELTPTQQLLTSSLAGLLAREMSYERVRRTQADGGADIALWKSLAEAGWLSLPFVDHDTEASLIDVALAVEEVAKTAAVVPYMETMACAFVLAEGTDRAADLADAVQDGRLTLAPAMDRRSAATVQDGFLSGVKRFVDYGQVCTHHVVDAVEDGEPRLYLVEAGVDAVACASLSHVARTPQATVSYHGAAARRVGGPETVERLRAVGTVLASVELVALAQVALDLTVGHVRERVQFGRPLGAFQAVQHQCADMAMVLEAARFLVYETAWKVAHRQASWADVATAKAAASRAGVFVTMQAHQLHGGIGVTEEYPLQFFSRRSQGRAVAWLSQHEALLEVSRTVDKDEQWV